MNQVMNNNPLFNQARKMIDGKNEEEIKTTIFNVAKQKGIQEEQLKRFAQQFGIKL